MHSHTQITLTGKDKVGCKHEIVIQDCPENNDWFILRTKMDGQNEFTNEVTLPKIFIPALTEAINKFY